ncbi:sugar phosphate isomerase/epimerase family protein [Sinanaerobacter chloroacetimidivorans]|jgi:L-ribulose-5-phosphate 3-epimerase|uniref:Sugar phosphate isomerase/epimerase n=1 Tax=Sinanaerobacter chloroacetimidivorans TaxID=2818044 RepID=A0A8J7W079_9FIRM|nr:sugar phosphate isomerase/epimerase family protein [Sinanaerobacter chloroacetimidivorans]MBR0598382.1 sugar phosphate isomerase/epimerase [Sinanaerobacter chloroacetimidivorans]
MERIIGVNSNCYHGYAIEEAIEGIGKAGFHYIELTATKGWTEHVFPTMSFTYLNSVKKKLREAKLIPFAMSGHCNLMDRDRIDDFISNMKLAAFFGCEYIVSSIGEAHLADKAVVSNEEVAGHVKELIPYLKEDGLKLVLEVHGDHGTGVILKDIVDRVDSDLVSINYDTANAIYYGDVEMENDLDACLEKIGFIHLKEKAGGKKEWNFPALGKGYVDFAMLFQKLEQGKNPCPFSIEIEFTQAGPKDLKEINDAVQTSYDYLKEYGFEL